MANSKRKEKNFLNSFQNRGALLIPEKRVKVAWLRWSTLSTRPNLI